MSKLCQLRWHQNTVDVLAGFSDITTSRGIPMNTTLLADPVALIEDKTTAIIDELIDSLPDPKQLTSEERRGIIARYTSVLEGNFIYWMTAAVIAAKAEQSRPILLENLYEEVHDCHPLMLRKFAIAANAFPTDKDALAVHDNLTKVRQFMGKLSPVKSVLTMGFFEGFIQKFMSYLAYLAAATGLDGDGVHRCPWCLRHRAHRRALQGIGC